MKRKDKCGATVLIAIVGGSGSGKTWLADHLATALGVDVARLSLDDFYRDRSHLSSARRAQINFDQPRAIDWLGVETAVRALLVGRAVRIPRYDFKTHSRLNGFKIVPPRPIVLMDGLWLLRPRSLRRLFQLSIFIDCPTRTRLQRRLARDVGLRGRTAISVKDQFWRTVEPMHRVYVVPQRTYADLVLRGAVEAGQIADLARRIRAGVRPN